VRVREGWLAVIRGVDELEHPSGAALMRYCAGVIIQDADRLDRVIFRSPGPSSSPGLPARSTVPSGNVVFPTAIDARGERAFDIHFRMADYEIGRGRLDLCPENGCEICASTVKW
jgi:predicted GH43/DUF377 family glycosyl hydrolase